MKNEWPPEKINNDLVRNDIETKKDSWFDSYILKNEKFKVSKTTFPRPFLIQTNEKQYGILNEEGLYFTDPEDFEKAEKAFYGYQWLVSEMDNRTSNNTHYDSIHVDCIRETLSEINEIFKKSKHISPAFISEKSSKENPEVFYEEFQNYLILLNEVNREKIEDYFNFKFGDFTMREQFYFLNFIKSKDKDEVSVVKNLTSKFGINAFRTFLSIEQGGKEMGDKILALGEKLPEEVARKVFAKYGEIMDGVGKITEFAKNNFKREINTNPDLIHRIENTLYTRGKQLLSDTYEEVSGDKVVGYEDLLTQLDRINRDTITTFAIYKQAVKNGEKLSIETMDGAVFSKKDATDVLDEQIREMNELYDKNYKDHADRKFILKVKEYFNTAFAPESNKEKNFFYNFEKDRKIRAFVRFEKKEDGSLYASALNVDDASKNFGIGEAMMDEALSIEAKSHVLRATCLLDSPSNMRYFEKGFISKEYKPVENTNQFDLVWDEEKNRDILSKNKTEEELIQMFENKKTENLLINRASHLEDLYQSRPEGKALTRCFLDKQSGDWFAVYEEVSKDYGVKEGDAK